MSFQGPAASSFRHYSPSVRSAAPHEGNTPAHYVPDQPNSLVYPHAFAPNWSHPIPRTSPSGALIFYLRDYAQVERIISQFPHVFAGPLGFDMEWKPNRIKNSPPNKTALIQLAAPSIILLVQVSAMLNFPYSIRRIIEDSNIIKAGVGIEGDAFKLFRDFGISAAGCLELSNLARAVDTQWTTSRGMIGLARLAKAYGQYDMKKEKRIQLSNWEEFLTLRQQDYAAEDAIAALVIFQKLHIIMSSISSAPSYAEYLFNMSPNAPSLGDTHTPSTVQQE